LAGLPEQHEVEQAREDGGEQGVECRREFTAGSVGHRGGAQYGEPLGQGGLNN